MRFLAIGNNGNGVMTANENLVFATSATLRKRGVIGENIPSTCPVSMLQASNGTLLVATGLGPMYRMRYNESELTPAGVPAPQQQPTILQSQDYGSEAQGVPDPLGTGKNILTIPYDFSQYGPVYRIGNYSVTTEGKLSMAARGAFYNTNASRFAAIEAGGLTNGELNAAGLGFYYSQLFGFTAQFGIGIVNASERPFIWTNLSGTVTVYADNADNITGQYQCFQRWVDKDGYVSDPGPLSSIAEVDGRNIIKYQNVDAPLDDRITYGGKRQIWRNTSGQLQNFYLDIETTDMTRTEFTSSNTDEQLVLNDVITFTDVDGYTIPYLYAQPPDDKPFIAELRGRIFAVGSRRYSEGSVQVVNGSATVTGIGTSWTSSLVGRRLIAGGREYTIKAVDDDAQTLETSNTYAGETDNFAQYVIAPYAAEELVVRWSDPVAGPEAWPLSAQLLLPQDGDVITGLVNYGDALYITKTRNIYRLNFTEDPAVDGEVSPAARRGCINNRCAVTVEGACLMLDREGIHAFIGGPNPQHMTLPVGDLFREETNCLHINWSADMCMLHAIHHQEISTVKWYVPMASDTFPSHAICYDYRRSRIWVESYPRPITSSCHSLAITGRPLLGTTEGRILAADVGSLDLIAPGGTFFSIAAINSPVSITLDATPKECDGVPCVIVNGTAAGIDRTISYQTGTEIQFLTPMDVMPSVGDKVQIGGIPFRFKTAAFDAERMDGNNPKSVTLKFDPNATNLYGSLSVFKNGLATASTRAAARSPWGATSRNHLKNAKHVTLNLGSTTGMVIEQLSFSGEKDTPVNLEFQFQVDGSSGESKVRITEMKVDGAG